MKNITLEIGDVFLIPYQDKYAVCKTLWISKKTKNAFSFIVKDKLVDTKAEALEIIDIAKNISVQIFTGLISVFYTDITKLKKGEWEIIGSQKLTIEESNNLQYHNIAGKLFKGDQEVRPLNDAEIKIVPKMLNAGYEAINNFLKMAFG
ncbi:Imm26 family immunity protein [Myroides sp. LJL116]